MKKNNNLGWEKEFEEKFTSLNDFGRPELNRFMVEDYNKESVIRTLDEQVYLAIKSFIARQIKDERLRVLGEVRLEKKKTLDNMKYKLSCEDDGYNQAVADLEKLKEKLK